jgi:hypothetical protein
VKKLGSALETLDRFGAAHSMDELNKMSEVVIKNEEK